MKATVVLASTAIALCLAFGMIAFFRSWEEARLVKDYCIPLIDSPIDLTKKSFMEFKFSRKYDVPYFATAFLDCDKTFPIDKISIHGTAKILDKEGKVLGTVDLEKDYRALGFPTIKLNDKMFYPLLDLPNNMGDYTLQIFLDQGVSGLPKETLYIRACYMSSMPLLLKAKLCEAAGFIAFAVAGIIILFMLGFILWKKRRQRLPSINTGCHNHKSDNPREMDPQS
ncbi:MAG: hypothetical protein A2X49_09365 [Lentisphaerae bacterium GWF2_52_8]|nr:MAG: hypothetical protein A2X49_09365 [Lentisphaerae bacterium GWF2_52_8]